MTKKEYLDKRVYKAKDVKIFVGDVEIHPDQFPRLLECIIPEFIDEKEEKKVWNTDIETKQKYWPKFAEFIENQFKFGGKKYQLSNGKEITDWVCELSPGKTGADWVIQTICKYGGRFINLQLEQDIFKIATYAFIMWLKMGFHLKDEHDEDNRGHE